MTTFDLKAISDWFGSDFPTGEDNIPEERAAVLSMLAYAVKVALKSAAPAEIIRVVQQVLSSAVAQRDAS
jgi:hypothetical protein